MHNGLIVFSGKHEQKEQNIIGLEQEEHEGGVHDFARGNDCIGWKRGYGEIFFSKNRSIKLHED